MKFAFSTAACRDWDFETIAARATEMKYQGVELGGSHRESDGSAANLFLTDAGKLAGLFANQGVEVACIASSAVMTGDKQTDRQAAEDCRRCIDAAAELNCQTVKIPDGPALAGRSRTAAGIALGDWLVPLGDYGAQRNICLVLENAQGGRSSREMWAILDRISHPAIRCCWNILNATLMGESPFVSVPTLSGRIGYAIVGDARIVAAVEYCKLGEGDVPAEKFITRLRGIGFGGWVTFSGREEFLADAFEKLHAWIQPPHKAVAHGAKH